MIRTPVRLGTTVRCPMSGSGLSGTLPGVVKTKLTKFIPKKSSTPSYFHIFRASAGETGCPKNFGGGGGANLENFPGKVSGSTAGAKR